MYDFQSAMAEGKARAQRDRNRGELSSPFRCYDTARQRYGDMTEDDWKAWQNDMGEPVDASSPGGLHSETKEETPHMPAKPQKPKSRVVANSPFSWAQIRDPKIYLMALTKLGITPYGAGRVLGISPRMSMRYSNGEWPVPEHVARHVAALILLRDHGIERP